MRFAPNNETLYLVGLLRALWTDRNETTPIVRPSHFQVALLDILPDRDVLCSLFSEDDGRERRQRFDRTVDDLNDRYGKGEISLTSSMDVVKTRDHGRIPFGKPTEVR